MTVNTCCRIRFLGPLLLCAVGIPDPSLSAQTRVADVIVTEVKNHLVIFARPEEAFSPEIEEG